MDLWLALDRLAVGNPLNGATGHCVDARHERHCGAVAFGQHDLHLSGIGEGWIQPRFLVAYGLGKQKACVTRGNDLTIRRIGQSVE